MIKVDQLGIRSIATSVFLLNIVTSVQAADRSVKEQLRQSYSSIQSLGYKAVSDRHKREIVTGVASDGRFAFLQYDFDIHHNIYGDNRDVSEEWKTVPAHFNYYDGDRTMYSTASADPANLFVEHVLDQPMALGESIQQKGCIWPLISYLLDSGEITEESDQSILVSNQLDFKIYFNEILQIRRVTWGEKQNDGDPLVVFAYSGYAESFNPLLPTKMDRYFSGAEHEHYTLEFISEQNDIENLLVFTDDSKAYSRKNASTTDVYDADGKFLYNEKEEEVKYLALINDSGPSQTRYLLLISVGVIAIGSAWVLKRKKSII